MLKRLSLGRSQKKNNDRGNVVCLFIYLLAVFYFTPSGKQQQQKTKTKKGLKQVSQFAC